MKPKDITELLKRDSERRRIGIKDGLYDLSEIKRSTFTYPVPTITNNSRWKKSYNKKNMTNKEFRKKFYDKYSIFEKINTKNILFAGSCVGSFLIGQSNDIDMFIYGLSPEEASKRVQELVTSLCKYQKPNSPHCNRYQINQPEKNVISLKEYAVKSKVDITKCEKYFEFCSAQKNFIDNYTLCVEELQKKLKGLISDNGNFDTDEKKKTYEYILKKIKDIPNPGNTSNLEKLYSEVQEYIRKNLRFETSDFFPECNYCDFDDNVERDDCSCKGTCVKNMHAIDITRGDQKYQIILRIYGSISEILHGFDLGSSSIGFDGEKVYFTELGKFAYKYGCNILDPSKRSTSYEHRLKKYFERGFDIVLPDLDISKLDDTFYHLTGNYDFCKLPRLAFSYSECSDNKIILKNFVSRLGNSNQDNSDYDIPKLVEEYDPTDSSSNYALLEAINKLNIMSLSKGDLEKVVLFVSKPKELFNPNQDIFNMNLIRYRYGQLKTELLYGKAPITRMKPYFCNDETLELLCKHSINGDKKAIKEVFDAQIAFLETQIDKYFSTFQKNIWNVQDPMGQFTGSFKPIATTKEEWYGVYLKE